MIHLEDISMNNGHNTVVNLMTNLQRRERGRHKVEKNGVKHFWFLLCKYHSLIN